VHQFWLTRVLTFSPELGPMQRRTAEQYCALGISSNCRSKTLLYLNNFACISSPVQLSCTGWYCCEIHVAGGIYRVSRKGYDKSKIRELKPVNQVGVSKQMGLFSVFCFCFHAFWSNPNFKIIWVKGKKKRFTASVHVIWLI